MHIRKLAAWLLAIGVTFLLLPAASAAEKANLSLSADKDTIVAGDTITVTVSNAGMKISSLLGGFRFATGQVTCTSISTGVSLKKTAGGTVSPTAVSTVAEANENGTVAFAFVGTQDVAYAAGTILTATFKVRDDIGGPIDLTLYESSDGTNAFSAASLTDVLTKRINLSLQPLGRVNLARTENGGHAFANSAKNSSPVTGLNDGTNVRWQPTETAAGSSVYAGIYWKTSININEVVFYWRDVQYSPALTVSDYIFQVSTDTTNGKDGTWRPVTCSVKRFGPGGYLTIVGANLKDSNGDTTQKNCAMDTVTFPSIAVKGVRLEMKMPAGGQIQLFEMEVYETAEYAPMRGDVNGDRQINADDLTTLARHVGMIAFIEDGTLYQNADVNQDKEVGSSDLTRLARHVAGIESL